jgi:stage II sporulation protein D
VSRRARPADGAAGRLAPRRPARLAGRACLAGLALLAAILGLAPASATGELPAIRVALVAGAPALELRGLDIDVVEIGGCDRCPRYGWRTDAVHAVASARGVEIDGRQAGSFRLRSDRPIRLNGREYRGGLDLVRNGDGLAVVNELPLEEYLVGVLRAEAGDRWPLEALRAQAIVARTYAAYQRLLNAAKPYHVVASTAHQQFGGRVPGGSAAWDAVRDTIGQVLYWEGELFPAFYHTDSGGFTEDPRLVFAARNMPALKPVRCEFSTGSPHFYWSLDVRLPELTDVMQKNDVPVGTVMGLDVTERTPSLRAAVVTVRGSRGSARIRGNDFRRLVGYDTLKSTLFAVTVDGDVAHFSGHGYGHGVGLCQWGAKAMAEQGYRAKQILDYYYPGATLGWLDQRSVPIATGSSRR